MPSRRHATIAVLALVAGAVAGFLWWRRAPAARAPEPERLLAAAPPSRELAAPAASPSPRRYTVRTESTVADLGAEAPGLGSLGAATAAEYRQRARFPRSSQPIDDGLDPIARDREVTRDRSLGPEGRDPTLVTYPARAGFEAPSPVILYAYLVEDERKVDARTIRGEVRNQDGQVLAALAFRDDGEDGDAEANDLVFTARLAPPRAQARAFKGAQLVEVRAEPLNGGERVAVTGFLYSIPLAHLTGRYRDDLTEGHLRIAAEVTVDEPGRFHLEATLAAPDGTPLAWAQNALELAPGTAWIPLTYWGLILRERGVDGPYVLRSVALSTTGEMPNQMNDVAENAYTTAAYRAAQFSDQPFGDPELLEAAERLEAEAPLAVGGLEAEAR